ncbi:MAG: M20/M25/M40 family metallo-hydrolase [Candidatus Cryptobacteroides sp.]
MDLDLFREILLTDSTSGRERLLAEFLAERLKADGCDVHRFEVGDGTLNLLLDWSGTGKPSFVFCSHLDTVPPYISPGQVQVRAGDILPDGKTAASDDTMFTGRGTCDAKGQFFTMYSACLELASAGRSDFGLLLLSGEETGSFGAKAYNRDCPGGKYLLVGEPTDNRFVRAGKGTKSFEVTLRGKACHSGYPEHGRSAVNMFVDFMNRLDTVDFPEDPILGKTTWNVGRLSGDNPQNILCPELKFRIYFRTTFATDELVLHKLEGICPKGSSIEAFGGDSPLEYHTGAPGMPWTLASFGSDAPRLEKFGSRAICGPGSILTAHTADEYVLLSQLEEAKDLYLKVFGHVMQTEQQLANR